MKFNLKTSQFSQKHLNGFKKVQRLAYDSVEEVRNLMQEGFTEKQTAALIETYLRDHGIKSFFHKPFAWFGDRTCFAGVKKYKDFSPSDRPYEEGDVVILDVAPILNGYVGDIGYSFVKGANKNFSEMKKFLLTLRKILPDLFWEYQNHGGELWQHIDHLICRKGYDNIHEKYPFSVLGHQVHRIPSLFGRFEIRTPTPFSFHAFWPAVIKGVTSQLLNKKHKQNLKGMWAIEPHLGCGDFGMKFEEILVFDGNKAYWLDDNVPHLK